MKVRMTSAKLLADTASSGRHYMGWYRYASSEICEAASLLETDPHTLASYLALYSPRVQVKRSIRLACHRVQTGEHARGAMAHVRAAVEHWEQTGEIRGPKTRAFRDALLGDESAIVLDVWMARALGVDQRAFGVKSVYAQASGRVADAAGILGVPPARTQAAIWGMTISRAGLNAARMILVRDTLYGRELAA